MGKENFTYEQRRNSLPAMEECNGTTNPKTALNQVGTKTTEKP